MPKLEQRQIARESLDQVSKLNFRTPFLLEFEVGRSTMLALASKAAGLLTVMAYARKPTPMR